MILICKKPLPIKKCFAFSLSVFFGLGLKSCFLIYQNLGFSFRKVKSLKDLTKTRLSRLEEIIESNSKIELHLKKNISDNIFLLRSIKSYRGLRHLKGLPLRGQRTRTNGKTAKRVTRSFFILKKENFSN